MKSISQSPTDPEFVQNPYPFYDTCRQETELLYWQDYDMKAVFDYEAVSHILKDKRFGREIPTELQRPIPERLRAFYDIEAHSMLELEAPRHTRLRGLVLRAFTSRRIGALGPEIEHLSHELIDQFPPDEFDLISSFANQIPVVIIARLLGVPESMAPELLRWSNDMVMMYQAKRTTDDENRAVQSSQEFSDFMKGYIKKRRHDPADDLITHLIAAEEEGEKLSTDELITTCILLLNAGHEATVHTLGNGIKTLLENKLTVTQDTIETCVEEILRFDPPLHMFTRYCYEDITLFGRSFNRGDQVALMLGSTGRDPKVWEDPNTFDPTRSIKKNTAFGGGIHFCVGAPLARLELQKALPILFERCPNLSIAQQPTYANVYHFHGLDRLIVSG